MTDRINEKCQYRIELELPRRPANALNIEIATPFPRCTLKPPAHWPEGMVLRWLASGGEALVLGKCTRNCPLDREEEAA